MKAIFTILLSTFLFSLPAAADAPLAGQYIVVLKSGVEKPAPAAIEATAEKLVQLAGGKLRRAITHTLPGFIAALPDGGAEALRRHPLVETVVQDYVMNGQSAPNYAVDCTDYFAGLGYKTQTTYSGGAPQPIGCPWYSWCFDNWGLDRVDQRQLPLSGSYDYGNDGSGVHVYFLDAGLNYQHAEFLNNAGLSRIGNGINFAYYTSYTSTPVYTNTGDCNGHGSHVAAIAAGRRYGVAKGATLHPVKVVGAGPTKNDPDTDCDSEWAISWMIEGVDWVARNHVKPAVVNISANSTPPTDQKKADAQAVMERAIQNLIANYGVAVVNSAGNAGENAASWSPAGMNDVIVVAGSAIDDYPMWTTNFGPTVDLFAPSEAIPSAFWFGADSVCRLTGTSMAAPHVTGAIARYLQNNPAATPAQVWSALAANATQGVMKGNLGWGTPNRLLYVPR